MLKVHLFISGRVQGVGFRFFTAQKARSLGLSGWVRNLSDGRVEMVLAGPNSLINKMITTIKEGVISPLARVEKVVIKDRKEIKNDPFKGHFEILPSQ